MGMYLRTSCDWRFLLILGILAYCGRSLAVNDKWKVFYMKNVSIILYTDDHAYANYFIQYDRQRNNNQRYQLKVYTDKSVFMQSISNKKFNILLTDDDVLEDLVNNFDCLVSLTEVDSDDERAMNKYRPIETIISNALSLFYEVNGAPQKSLMHDTKDKVITFYSGSGNEGKTLLSLCLAKSLQQLNHKVLYINLETYNTMDLYFKSKKQNSTELFYYLKSNPEKIMSKIGGLTSTDDHTGIDYIYYPVSPDEINELTSENMSNLIDAVKRTRKYQYIIIDLDSSINEKNKYLLFQADELFWILDHTEKSFYTSKYLLENELEEVKKLSKTSVHYILNKKKADLFSNSNTYNFSIIEEIPYKEEWDGIDEAFKVQRDTEIGRTLYQIIENIIPAKMEV